MNKEKLETLAKDLTQEYPRSPREMLGGFVIAARCVDKCRSFLLGKNGEYNYWPCSLCSQLEEFTGVPHEDLKTFVATGADDEAVGEWLLAQSKVKDPLAIIRWNNKMRDMRLSEMSDEGQEYLEAYIPKISSHPSAGVRLVRRLRYRGRADQIAAGIFDNTLPPPRHSGSRNLSGCALSNPYP